jgi:predicted nucleic acid-binding protein
MPGPYTIDASVFLNAFNPKESGQAESQRFLSYLQENAIPIIIPTLLLPEVAATIARGSNDSGLALKFATALARLPHLVLVPLDFKLAGHASDIAAQYLLRGSDAIYATVAIHYGSTLVTLDREQHDRVNNALKACYPKEILAN